MSRNQKHKAQSALKENLSNKIAAMGPNFKRSTLASKAGVTQETLSLILTGKVKNPGVYTIDKIAKVLNCSADELIGRDFAQNYAHANKTTETIKFKPDLASSCAITVMDLLDQKRLNIDLGKLVHIFKIVYGYSLSKNSEMVDTHFANWFIDYFNKENVQ